MLVEEQKIIAFGRSVLETEAKAILELTQRINGQFVLACQTLLSCTGRIVVTGMGKSGHISRKIAATLSSTGSPALFVHPGEASHGDLGMITAKDVVMALSYSGETAEILTILPLLKRLGIPIIALTGSSQSTMAKHASIHLDIGVIKEACPLGLAPTASTTAMIALGDALALAVLEARGFTAEDFAFSHPGGRLGRRLLLKVEDIMYRDEDIPRVNEDALLIDALMEMTQKRLGFTTIVCPTDPKKLLGIFTDGDLRRTLHQGTDIHKTSIREVMTTQCQTVMHDMLAHEALHLMEKIKVLVFPVLNKAGQLVGAFNMHELFKAGIV